MIRRSPCEVYLKFLVTHPDNKTTLEIRGIIESQHLDVPSDAYVDGLREQIVPPHPFKPTDKLHAKSFNFLVKNQILGFYHPDESCMMAHRYMVNIPRAKEVIETMAIAGEGPASIAHRLRTMNIKATVEAVKRYLSFYWDLNLVDSLELRALIKMRFAHLQRSSGSSVGFDKLVQYEALKKAMYKDSRWMMVEMSSTPIAGIMNQMRLGLMPTKADLSKLATAVRFAAIGRAFEATLDSRPSAANDSQGFTLVAKIMGEIIEDIGDPDATLQNQLHALSVKNDMTPIPTIHQLSAGKHTTDMGPEIIEGQPIKGANDE